MKLYGNLTNRFEENKNYQKAIRFASPELKAELQSYIETIKKRNEIDRKNRIYSDAMEKMSSSTTEQSYRDAASLFQAIPGWKDADDKREQALAKAETKRRQNLYDDAVNLAAKGDSDSISKAIGMLNSISDSKLAEKKAKELSAILDKVKNSEALAEKERFYLEKLQRQYDEEYRENLTLIRERDNIVKKKREDEYNLSMLKDSKFPSTGFLLIVFGIGVFILGIVIHKDPYDPGFIQLCAVIIKFCTIILGPILGYLGIHIIAKGLEERTKNKETKLALKKEIADYEKKMAILKNIPTFDEYVEAHKN